MFDNRIFGKGFAALAVFGFLTALTACADMNDDYRLNNPIQVSRQPFNTVVALPSEGQEEIAGEDLARLREFADIFIKKGDSVIEISLVAQPDEDTAKKKAQVVMDTLVSMGVHSSEIAVQINAAQQEAVADTAMLSFFGYVAEVPVCGDWSENSSLNYSNSPSKSFGCSQQRNIGLMVSNPRDLLQRRPGQPRSGAVGAGVAGKYNTGTDTRNKTTVSGAVAAQSQGQGGGN